MGHWKQTGFLCASKSMIKCNFTMGREKLFPKYLDSLCLQKSVNYSALIINMNYSCIKKISGDKKFRLTSQISNQSLKENALLSVFLF